MSHPPKKIKTTILQVIQFSLICLFLVSCSKNQTPDPTQSATQSLSPTQTSLPILPTAAIQTIEIPTSEQTSNNSSSSPDAGLIIFSMADGKYDHLFVYNPYGLPPTRLTASNWDDRYPAVSPDGTKIVFTSNRDGQWDIYMLDLKADSLTRITQMKTFDSSPSWSPDGQYIVYQTVNGENLDLIVQSITDLTSPPIQLTASSGNNYDPAWSPDGRQIAFVTDRTGRSQIWLADLQSADNRFSVIAASDEVDFSHPAWSPDSTLLAWCALQPEPQIQSMSISTPGSIKNVGFGCNPIWSPDGTTILATFEQPNAQFLVAYNASNGTLAMPMIEFNSSLNSMDWKAADLSAAISVYINLQTLPAPEPLYTQLLSLPESATGRKGAVPLQDVTVENAYLADTANESFDALRQAVGERIGWDYLNALDSAYLPLTSAPAPGIEQNWLYTGRAIAVNTVPLDAGWMAVTREDFKGETYWRVWLKCLDQSGACGEPMQTAAWDFSTRYSGDTTAYENGGQLSTIPSGYWFDFTDYAQRFGWERLPAQNDWRYYLNGALFNQFIFRQGLTWQQAMLELYPPEVLQAVGYEVKNQ